MYLFSLPKFIFFLEDKEASPAFVLFVLFVLFEGIVAIISDKLNESKNKNQKTNYLSKPANQAPETNTKIYEYEVELVDVSFKDYDKIYTYKIPAGYNFNYGDILKIRSFGKVSQVIVKRGNYIKKVYNPDYYKKLDIIEKVQKKRYNDEFLVRDDPRTHRHSNMKKVDAEVKVLEPNSNMATIEIEAFRCEECKHYFIKDSEYRDLLKFGIPICKIIEYEVLKNQDINHMSQQSMLNAMGYNVNANTNLSVSQRRLILKMVIKYGIMNYSEVLKLLQHLITFNGGRKNMNSAIKRWEADKEYVLNNFRNIGKKNIKVGIKVIRVRKDK